MGNELIQVVYLSRSTRRITGGDLQEIQTHASLNSVRNGVTGVLIYGDSHFLQLLEGDPEAVEETLVRIKRDSRHTDLKELMRRAVTERASGMWSMGVIGLDMPPRLVTAADMQMGCRLQELANRCQAATSDKEATEVIREMIQLFVECKEQAAA